MIQCLAIREDGIKQITAKTNKQNKETSKQANIRTNKQKHQTNQNTEQTPNNFDVR